MTLQVAVVGIDGSGKSTLAASLAAVLAGEHGLVAGSAVADEFWVRAPDTDLCGPKFHPQGFAIAARLDRLSRQITRMVVDNRALYPSAKVFQMLLQDNAAVKLSRKYGVDVMVSDGNLLLSGAGRAFNYRGPLNDPPTADDVDEVFQHLLHGRQLKPETRRHAPDLKTADALALTARVIHLQGIWIPDQTIFLDLSPEAAAARVRERGKKVDRHENVDDFRVARDGYLRVLDVVRKNKGAGSVHVIEAAAYGPGATLMAAVDALRPQLPAATAAPSRGGALHESGSRRSVLRRVLSYGYLGRYFLRRLFEGAWREPLFPLSGPGRTFLRDGYSAGVMRLIYDQSANAGFLERTFFGYPLHRAVRDRLAILERNLESELRKRLEASGEVHIFTAPSGFAYDLTRPLTRIAASDPALVGRVVLVAADLDPAGDLGPELSAKAKEIGLRLEYLRGDLTASGLRSSAERFAPFDLALFVGLSSWLPKPALLAHLRWLRTNLRPDGLLVTDSFTPAAYATGGAAMGYKASYYPPEVMRALVDYCGFDGLGATVESGRDGINHVLIAKPAL